MKILQFDSVGGASGDMILGALIDLGVPAQLIQDAISSLGVEDIHLHADKVIVDGIHGTRVDVHCHDVGEDGGERTEDGHDHEHGHHDHDEHDHGHSHGHTHEHHHHDEHGHVHGGIHGHEHDHGHHHPSPITHSHSHRNLHDIEHIIRESSLTLAVQGLALKVFERLGQAEAKVHGTAIDKIHFHEVGALDSIADIVGSCMALDYLKVDAVTFGPLPQGRGTIKCAHGTYPNPPPATLLLLEGLPIEQTEEPFELVTPTGAALLSTWRSLDRAPTGSTPSRVGYGFGQRKLSQRINCLRAVLLDSASDAEHDTVLVLETNLDDTTPEIIGALCEHLMSEGALDTFTSPVFMKKQRPATLLTVLCKHADREKLLNLIFRESTTFGVREYEAKRTILARTFETVTTKYGDIRIKIGSRSGAIVARSPEMDDCIAAARRAGVPVREVYLAASVIH